MKKLLFGFAVLGAVVACTPKVIAPTPPPPPETVTEEPVTPPTPSTPSMPIAMDEAEAAGQKIFNKDCTKCHSAKVIGDYTKAQWGGILTKMSKMAKLDAEQTSQVSLYVYWELEN